MKVSPTALPAACLLGLQLLASGASAQGLHVHEHAHPDIVLEGRDSWDSWRTRRATGADSGADSERISTTPDNQILVELLPGDTVSANLFDLNGRTLVFTPDGDGGYSRSVRPVAWEEDIGQPVADGTLVDLRDFTVDFAGRRWDAFFVSRHGLITFGEPLTYSYWAAEHRFDTMREIAGKFVTTPTVSPLYKPMLGGRSDRFGATQHVARQRDRVVVTWTTTEPDYYVHGVPPETPARFQAVLNADGNIRFSYRGVSFLGDGIVGLFPAEGVQKGDLIASITDPTDPELPGHLDLQDVSIYESNTGSLIVEWTMRDRVPTPPSGTNYSYRLYFDTDEPYFDGDGDIEFVWSVDVVSGDAWTRGGRRLPTDAPNRIALLVEDHDAFGITASVKPDAAQFDDGRFVQGNWKSRSTLITLPNAPPTTDLSRSASGSANRQREVFHYRGVPDTESIACRVIETLGDEFDLFVFHNEFRVDSQESGTPVRPHYGNTRAEGTGISWNFGVPCGEGRFKTVWVLPVWMKSDHVVSHSPRHNESTRFDRGLLLFAHEFTHAWTAHLSYLKNGSREPLFGQYCRCHWRPDLHLPAAFPWHPDDPGPRSLMGGRYWRENGDGTFTPLDGYWGGGHSWLDLYAMGLAEAREVPDTFILRNLRPVNERDAYGPHTGDKEIVTIEQVVAAEGLRIPSPSDAQKDFNAAFVYLLEPGRRPDRDLLRLHAEHRDKVIEHWSHVTGGRSRMTTTTAPSAGNRAPTAVGTLPDRAMPVDGVAVVDVGRAFQDPDGDPLTYRATSSAPAVASVTVASSMVTVRAMGAGTATVTVTATDAGGSNTAATLAFRVTVRARATFTDDPIVPGVTPVRAVHFTELRERIDLLRRAAGLGPFSWTDPVLTAGTTPVRLVHLIELRDALAEAYGASGRAAPTYTDAVPMSGATPIRAAHLTELRAAVLALQ